MSNVNKLPLRVRCDTCGNWIYVAEKFRPQVEAKERATCKPCFLRLLEAIREPTK